MPQLFIALVSVINLASSFHSHSHIAQRRGGVARVDAIINQNSRFTMCNKQHESPSLHWSDISDTDNDAIKLAKLQAKTQLEVTKAQTITQRFNMLVSTIVFALVIVFASICIRDGLVGRISEFGAFITSLYSWKNVGILTLFGIFLRIGSSLLSSSFSLITEYVQSWGVGW